MTKPTQNLTEAGQYLNVSATSLLDLIYAGEVPAAKISKDWVLRTADLDAYLEEKVREQTAQRREARIAGKPIKVMTEVSQVRSGKRRIPPVLPVIPQPQPSRT